MTPRNAGGNANRSWVCFRVRFLMKKRVLLLMVLGAAAVGTAVLRADAGRSDERSVTVLMMADTHAALNVHPEIFFD